MSGKVISSFNIFECGRNTLDRLDVTYQRAFMATPAENDNYKEMLENLIKVNTTEGRPLFNEKLRKSVIDLREHMDVEHKRSINNITCDDLYQSLMKNKYVSIINDSVYNESNKHVDKISDSRKQVDPRNDPLKHTHIIDGVNTLSIGAGPLEPAVI